MSAARERRRWTRRLVRGCSLVTALGLLALAMLLAALWMEHGRRLTLPSPTGPFSVGRRVVDWIDPAAVDRAAPGAAAPRELQVWIWYPAVGDRGSATADYLPSSMQTAFAGRGGPVLGLLTRDLSKVRSHARPDAPPAPDPGAFPVVLLRAGAAAEVVMYSTLAEDLASHGYVVVGLDAPYRTGVVAFPDGRVITRTPENDLELVSGEAFRQRAETLLEAWTGDMSFVLDRLEELDAGDPSETLAGRLDLGRVGVVGHSFGGAQALQFCLEDRRCRVGIDIDGAPFGSVIGRGLDRPFLFLLSDHGREPAAEQARILADIDAIYDRLPEAGRARIVIRGANHFTFSDDGALLKSAIFRRLLRGFGVLRIDGRRQLEITAYCVHRFFDATLGDQAPFAVDPFRYPEIGISERSDSSE